MRALSALLLATLTLACQKGDPPSGGSAPSASATGAVAAASAAPSAAASAPASPPSGSAKAAAGTFTGKYTSAASELYLPDTPEMKKVKWRGDEESAGVGPGELTLKIADDGTVSGESKGALGALAINGRAEGDHVTATLHPSAGEGFSGTLHATRKDGALEGDMNLTSFNANVLRKATFTLAGK